MSEFLEVKALGTDEGVWAKNKTSKDEGPVVVLW